MKDESPGHGKWPERLYVETARSYKEQLPWTDAAATEIHLRLAGCFQAINEATNKALSRAGFSGSQVRYSVLRSLYFAKNHCLSHAATSRRVSVTPGTLTRVIDGMESDGLVDRLTDAFDRRVTLIQLSPAGEAISAVLVPSVARLRDQLFAAFSDEEKRILVDLLRRLQARAENVVPGS